MRRCTVWSSSVWHRPDFAGHMTMEGWLLQINDKGTYHTTCVVVDEQGRMHDFTDDRIQVHVPTRIPLMDGAK